MCPFGKVKCHVQQNLQGGVFVVLLTCLTRETLKDYRCVVVQFSTWDGGHCFLLVTGVYIIMASLYVLTPFVFAFVVIFAVVVVVVVTLICSNSSLVDLCFLKSGTG